MKKYIPFILLISILISACGVNWNDEKTSESNFELQERCAKYAHDLFTDSLWDNDVKFSDYTNHFNSKLNKCFALIELQPPLNEKNKSNFSFLEDAVEHKEYWSDIWWFNKDWTQFHLCSLNEQDNTPQKCNSIEEFRQYAKQFMEN